MRMFGAAFVAAALLAFSATAADAQGWGMHGGGRSATAMGFVFYGTRDGAQCSGEEQIEARRAIAACGRIISERFSREQTAGGYYFRARLYRDQGDTERSQQDFARSMETLSALIESEPREIRHRNNRIALRLELGDEAGIIPDAEQMVALQPENMDARLALAELKFLFGDFSGAMTAFEAAAQQDPTNARAHSGRCESRAALRTDMEIAQQACELGVTLSGSSSSALASRGYLRFTQGNVAGAAADFRAALEKDNTNALAGYGHGIIGVRLGHETEGRQLMADVLEACPYIEVYSRAGLAL